MIDGLGRETPIVEDSNGYKTSDVPYRMDLMPGRAILHLGHIMDYGAKSHGDDNWLRGGVKDHVNKLLVHIFAYLAGDEQDDHLGHAAWRAMAALEIHLREKENTVIITGNIVQNSPSRAVCGKIDEGTYCNLPPGHGNSGHYFVPAPWLFDKNLKV